MKTEGEKKISETSDETHDGVLELIALQYGHFVCACDHVHVFTLVVMQVCVCFVLMHACSMRKNIINGLVI